MPRVPILNAPDVNPAPQPQVYQAEPPPAAFGGKVGEALSGVGQEFARIHTIQLMKEHENAALESETDYDEYARKSMGEFKKLRGSAAVAASEDGLQDLKTKRNEMKLGLMSGYAQQLFANNSQRIWDRSMVAVVSHADSELKRQTDMTYKRWLGTEAKTAATSGVAGEYDEKELEKQMKLVEVEAKNYAAKVGSDEIGEVEYAKGVVAKAMLVPLAKSNPTAAQGALEKYGVLLDPRSQLAAQTNLERGLATQTAGEIVAKLPTVDFSTGKSGTDNPDGVYDAKAVQDAKAGQDPRVVKAIDAAVSARRKAVDAMVGQAVKRIDAANADTGKPFSMSAADGNDLSLVHMNNGDAYRGLGQKEDRERRAAENRTTHNEKVQESKNYGSELMRIDTLSPEELKRTSSDELRTRLLEQGLTGQHTETLVKRLERNQKEDPAGLQRGQISHVTNAVVSSAMGNVANKQLLNQAKLEVHRSIAEAFERNPKMSYDEAIKFGQAKMKPVMVDKALGIFQKWAPQWQVDAAERDKGGVPSARQAPVDKMAEIKKRYGL